jgi:hypothetical protein
MQIEQFERIWSSLNLGSKQNGKFERFLSLSIRTSNAYEKLKAHLKFF